MSFIGGFIVSYAFVETPLNYDCMDYVSLTPSVLHIHVAIYCVLYTVWLVQSSCDAARVCRACNSWTLVLPKREEHYTCALLRLLTSLTSRVHKVSKGKKVSQETRATLADLVPLETR